MLPLLVHFYAVGPQAASHHSKVPSPAGAGFDERSSNQTRHETPVSAVAGYVG